MDKIVIIGSGMAGLGAAYRLNNEGAKSVVYDKNAYVGGHTASWKDRHGFIFDEGPHISFTKDERMIELFAESVNHEYESVKAVMNNHWCGHWIKHPVQCNLHGLPDELVIKVIRDFVDVMNTTPDNINTYEDWLKNTYGTSFARTFPMEYGLKYHTAPADRMTTDWLGPRLYRPSLEEVLRGALSPETDDVHYITDFRYPSNNGFASYLTLFKKRVNVILEKQVVKVDPQTRTLEFIDGSKDNYDHLITSVPLPELVAMIRGAPDDVVAAAEKLACSKCVLVNIGLDRDDISDAHVSYFYDRDYVFTRLSFPHMLSTGNAPAGCGSIQAELYYSDKYRPLDKHPEELVDPTINDLKRCGLIREEDRIITSDYRLVQYANVIYDHDRADALNKVQEFLDEKKIQCCGRYGEWGYYWTDESFKSGESAAQRILDSL
jgi:protoporphyrinogen oxidase